MQIKEKALLNLINTIAKCTGVSPYEAVHKAVQLYALALVDMAKETQKQDN